MSARRAYIRPEIVATTGRGCVEPHGPSLTQPTCWIDGLTHLLSITPGDFAVLLHSDPDCANLVPSDQRAVDPTRFYCTNLDERHATLEGGRDSLERAVFEIARTRRPEVLIVIGSCVASMIGEDLCGLVASWRGPLSEQTGCRLVAVDAGAFEAVGQEEVLDRFGRLWLRDASPARRPGTARPNLLGFPRDDGELEEILAEVGVHLNAWPFPGAPVDTWARLSEADLDLVSDERLFPGLLAEHARLGIAGRQLLPPVGLSGSVRFYHALGETLGVAERLEAATAGRRIRLEQRLQGALPSLRGRRLAYHVAGRKDFEFATVVREGLMWVGVFLDAGLEVELLFQGAVERHRAIQVERALARYDLQQLSYRLLPDRPSLSLALRAGGFDAVYCSQSLQEQAAQAAVRLVPSGLLRSGFSGMEWNLDQLTHLLTTRGR